MTPPPPSLTQTLTLPPTLSLYVSPYPARSPTQTRSLPPLFSLFRLCRQTATTFSALQTGFSRKPRRGRAMRCPSRVQPGGRGTLLIPRAAHARSRLASLAGRGGQEPGRVTWRRAKSLRSRGTGGYQRGLERRDTKGCIERAADWLLSQAEARKGEQGCEYGEHRCRGVDATLLCITRVC